MKKRDLKLDSAADRDRQERGGRDSRGSMRRGRQTLGTCFWDELRFDSLFFWAFGANVKKEKKKKKKRKRNRKKEKKKRRFCCHHCQSAVISKCLMAVAQAVLPSFSSFSNLAHSSDNMKVSVRFTADFCLLIRDRNHTRFKLCNCCVTWRGSPYLRISWEWCNPLLCEI